MRTQHGAHIARSQTVLTETHRGWLIEVSRRRTGFTIKREQFYVSVRSKVEDTEGGYFPGFHSVAMAVQAAKRFIQQHEGHQSAMKQVQLRKKHARTRAVS